MTMPDTFETLSSEIETLAKDYETAVGAVVASFQDRMESLTKRMTDAPISDSARNFLMQDLIGKLQSIGG
jgi:predicted RNA binding protein with dsRBD fold (UPF0201 family)